MKAAQTEDWFQTLYTFTGGSSGKTNYSDIHVLCTFINFSEKYRNISLQKIYYWSAYINGFAHCKPINKLVSLHICNFCFCSTLAAAVVKWDKEATEATIKHHAAEHLKHAPGRTGGGGHTGVENNCGLLDEYCKAFVVISIIGHFIPPPHFRPNILSWAIFVFVVDLS